MDKARSVLIHNPSQLSLLILDSIDYLIRRISTVEDSANARHIRAAVTEAGVQRKTVIYFVKQQKGDRRNKVKNCKCRNGQRKPWAIYNGTKDDRRQNYASLLLIEKESKASAYNLSLSLYLFLCLPTRYQSVLSFPRGCDSTISAKKVEH